MGPAQFNAAVPPCGFQVSWREMNAGEVHVGRTKKKKSSQNTVLLDCLLDLQVTQNSNVGVCITFIWHFLHGYFEFRDDKQHGRKSEA